MMLPTGSGRNSTATNMKDIAFINFIYIFTNFDSNNNNNNNNK